MSSNAAAKAPQLAGVQKVIYDRLRDANGGDVSIAVLYCAAFDVAFRDLPPDNKTRQMALGSYISKANEKLLHAGERIVIGHARRTYRLDKV